MRRAPSLWCRLAPGAFLLLSAGIALAGGYPGMQPLSGQWDLAGPTAVDPPPGERRDTHLRLFLAGAAARAVYERLPGVPRADVCGDPGGLVKSAGDMQCTRLPQEAGYECRFAIDLEHQTISGGWAC